MIGFGPGALAAAFAAGFVSFVSPCVLPLIPGYLSFVSGVGFDELGARPRRVATTTAAFVLGFAAMFVALGAGAAWFGGALLQNRRTLEIAAGAFIALAGLVFAGLPLPAVLLQEHRIGLPRGRGGAFTPVLAGVAFAIGWTPCVGPTLAGILALAAGGGHPVQGGVLLAVYALGLGIPFLLFGLAFTRSLGLVGSLRRHWRLVSATSGAVLVTFGVLPRAGSSSGSRRNSATSAAGASDLRRFLSAPRELQRPRGRQAGWCRASAARGGAAARLANRTTQRAAASSTAASSTATGGRSSVRCGRA